MSVLLVRFNQIAAMHPAGQAGRDGFGPLFDQREAIRAALLLGASLTLARIHEIGGSYVSSDDVRKVEDELSPMPAAKSPIAKEGGTL